MTEVTEEKVEMEKHVKEELVYERRGNATFLGGQSQLSHVTDILVMFFYMQRLRHMKEGEADKKKGSSQLKVR